MAMMGSCVSTGEIEALVVATGAHTLSNLTP